jgi:DNA-binding NarL/FixJ family response regulator
MPPGPRPKVLLADDHTYVLTAIERLLSWSCDVVGTVTTGEKLLEAAGRLRPDVIVIDLRLPDMSGIEACRQLKESAVAGKVILLTAADDPEIRKGAYESGAAAFVAKQRAGDELLPTIARVFNGRPPGSQPSRQA